MTSFSVKNMSIAGVFLLVLAAAYGEDKGGWEIHGKHQNPNVQTLGGSVSGPRDKLAVDAMRAGDYHKGNVEYARQLLTDGTKALNAHAGVSGDNAGNRAKNFGLSYQDPKNAATWNREIAGPVRTDTYRAERNFFTSPDRKATIDAYVEHNRNNFGSRNTEGGIIGRWGFGR